MSNPLTGHAVGPKARAASQRPHAALTHFGLFKRPWRWVEMV